MIIIKTALLILLFVVVIVAIISYVVSELVRHAKTKVNQLLNTGKAFEAAVSIMSTASDEQLKERTFEKGVLEKIKAKIPSFSYDEFNADFKELFLLVTNSYTNNSKTNLIQNCTDIGYKKISSDIDSFKDKGISVIFESIDIQKVLVKDVAIGTNTALSVIATVKCVNYKKNNRTGAIISGIKTPSIRTYAAEIIYNPNPLKEIEDSKATVNCRNCGAVIPLDSDVCEYCSSVSESKVKYAKSRAWLLNTIGI